MRRFAGRAVCLVGALVLALPATAVRADRFWTLQLRGGSILMSLDAPEERGPILVFHRAPDGAFSSLRTGDVLRISLAEGPPKKPKKSLDGEILVLGRDADPPDVTAPMPPPAEPPEEYASYPAPTYGGFAYGPPHRRHVRFRPPTTIGPNGFPILTPPGFPGSVPPAIGPNGFPILMPTPLPASPRGR